MGRSRAKTAEFTVSCAHPAGKSFPTNQWYQRKVHALKECFWGHNPSDISNSKWGTQNPQKFGFGKIHFYLSRQM